MTVMTHASGDLLIRRRLVFLLQIST